MTLNRPSPDRLLFRMAILVAIILPAACSDSGSFKVTGTVEGLGTQNLHVVYRDGNMMRTVTAPAVDSKFEFQGNSPKETVVEIFNNLRSPIGCFVIKNGETVDITLKVNDFQYLKASGNKTSEKLADFLTKNHGDSLNARIASEVAARPADFLSAVLLSCYFDAGADPEKAAELVDALDYEKIPPILTSGLREMLSRLNSSPTVANLRLRCFADSMMTVAPSDSTPTFYYLNDSNSISDSIANALDSIPKRIKLVHILTAPDSLRWSKVVALLPERTISLWAPGGVAEKEIADWDITSMPFIIVADSAGMPLYRGTDLTEAVNLIK